MGRRRTKDLDLPPRLYRRGHSFYYVSAAGKWHSFGRDKARALRLWAELECLPPASTSVADLVQAYLDYLDGDACADAVAPSTRQKYGRYAATIAAKFSDVAADDLGVPTLARWRDSGEVKPIWFNGCLAVLRGAYRKGCEWGFATTNAARACKPNATHVRERYIVDAEFRAIRDVAERWLREAMDIAYLTGMRQGDVLGLRWNAVSDRIYVEQRKTRRAGRAGTGTRQAFEISPALRSILEAAKRKPIVGLYVIATDKGRPISSKRLQKAFADARKAAGVEDVTFHDIRGKAGTDAYDEGMDHQAFLGHASKEMSDRYVKTKRTIRTPTLKRRV